MCVFFFSEIQSRTNNWVWLLGRWARFQGLVETLKTIQSSQQMSICMYGWTNGWDRKKYKERRYNLRQHWIKHVTILPAKSDSDITFCLQNLQAKVYARSNGYNPFLVYCRELALGAVSLTGDRAQGDDSKHDSYYTRDVFYVRREVDLMKMEKVNAYIMHVFGKIQLLSIHAT